MPKQLLIYESAIPVSHARHGGASVEPSDSYAFTAGVNAVPLMAVELVRAATEYAIVFAQAGEEVLPAAVLGVRQDQNLYLSSDGRWNATYVPAFIRRYPFVFSTSQDGRTLTLCIDESFGGLNREGRGQPLFTGDGKPTAYVDNVLAFMKDYQAHFERTKRFGARLRELGLLEPMQAQVTAPDGQKTSVGGFQVVSRAKLRDLAPEQISAMAKTDELELVYLHLYSMRNFVEIKDRFVSSLAAGSPAAEAATADGVGDAAAAGVEPAGAATAATDA